MNAARELDVRQIRRAVRTLLRQQGGTVLARLAVCHATVRIECRFGGGHAFMNAHASNDVGAAALQLAQGAVRAECQRVGRQLLQWECSGRSQPSAGAELTRAA
jgi:hypothetical protein